MKGFEQIFWGLLFWFDFNIQHFDILPDIIGYILIYAGLNSLDGESEYFAEAKKFTLILIVLSVFVLIPLQLPFSRIMEFVMLLMDLAVVYRICSGIASMARIRNLYQLAETAMNRWHYYMVVSIFMLLLFMFSFFLQPIAALLTIPLFIASVVVLVLLMGLIRLAQQHFLSSV